MLEQDLFRAFSERQFILHYQPIIDMNSGEIAGAEALLRWAHPEQGLLSAGDFIHLLDEFGFIVSVGQQMMEQACGQFSVWKNRLGYEFLKKININISPIQLKEKNILENIDRIIQETAISGDAIEFELILTPSFDESYQIVMQEIKNKGIGLLMDISYNSSIPLLIKFGIDKLQISLHRREYNFFNARTQAESQMLLKAWLATSQKLNIKTVVGGVETKEDLEFVKKNNGAFAKGDFFSPPLSAEAFTAFLAEKRVLL